MRDSKRNQMNTTQMYGLMMIAMTAATMLSNEFWHSIVRPVEAATVRVQGHTGPSAPVDRALGAALIQQNGSFAGGQGFGLIQQGVVGVSQMDARGQFGAPTALPVYQVVRIHHRGGLTVQPTERGRLDGSAGADLNKSGVASDGTSATPMPGIMVAPSIAAKSGPTPCVINDVALLTPSTDACLRAGGEVLTQAH